MSNSILFYPTLNVSLKEKVFEKIEYKLYYFSSNKEKTYLSCIFEGNSIIIDPKDKNNTWDNENYDLYLETHLHYHDGGLLYGSDGIAPQNAVLCLCIETLSQKNKYRKVFVNHEDTVFNDNEEHSITFECVFPKKTISKDINVNILLFLLNAACDISQEELFLNNKEGVILGTIDEKKVYLEGDGSLFPIYIKSFDKEEFSALWKFEFDYEDPAIDLFEDSIKIFLNSLHPEFDLVDTTSERFSYTTLNEVVAGAITGLICQLRDEDCLSDLSGDYPKGTILHFVKYYHENLGLNIESANEISESMRLYLESKGEK